MKSHRWWIALLVAVGGCGPVNYWVGTYTNPVLTAFPFLKPAGSEYQFPPGFEADRPIPRSGSAPKKPRPPEPPPEGDAVASPLATSPVTAPDAVIPNAGQ
jgi:hypothetical protein